MSPEQRQTAPCFAPTGPGWYLLRNEDRAYLLGRLPDDMGYPFQWVGHVRAFGPSVYWSDDGGCGTSANSHWDIIAPWHEPRTETRRVWLMCKPNDKPFAKVCETLEQAKRRWPGCIFYHDCGEHTVTEGEGM